jgi:hypothetical protein
MSEESKALTTDPRVVASRAAMATALRSPDHMKAWLDASGRRWLIFNAIDLVDSLTFPEGHQMFQLLVEAYRDYRRTVPTGRTETMIHPDTKQAVSVPLTKGETLEDAELDRAIRYLVGQMYERNPNWSLEAEAL